MLRPVLRNPLRSALRSPFATTTPGLSPLQQAVVAAWDAQGSGPFAPVVGGASIPAFNSPGTAELFPGFDGRRTDGASSQRFEGPNIPDLALHDGHTIRIWVRVLANEGNSRIFRQATARARLAGDWYGITASRTADPNTGFNVGTRNADDANNTSRQTPGNVDLLDKATRIEISRSGSTINLRFRGVNDDGSEFYELTTSHTSGIFTGGAPAITLRGDDADVVWGPMVMFNRALTTEERTADLLPRRYSQL